MPTSYRARRRAALFKTKSARAGESAGNQELSRGLRIARCDPCSTMRVWLNILRACLSSKTIATSVKPYPRCWKRKATWC